MNTITHIRAVAWLKNENIHSNVLTQICKVQMKPTTPLSRSELDKYVIIDGKAFKKFTRKGKQYLMKARPRLLSSLQ